ncbi:MAG TPA: MarR family transcriptional regulator [Thermoleophilaceae bacterium]|jgi:DNA-binding MarR family transcriptional regulator
MPPKPRRHTREAGAALAAAAPLASRWVERVLASHEPPLTVTQYLALRAIQAEPLSAAELARRTSVSGPAVSQLVSALEGAGLVERQPAEADRRTRGLALTALGTRTLDSATALVGERLAELLSDLPKPEADALTRLLERVEAALSGTAPPRRPHPPPPPHKRR